MNKMLKRQQAAIMVLVVTIIISGVCSCTMVKLQKKELSELQKINFELQNEADKLRGVNGTYYDRITMQQGEITRLNETLDRVLTLNEPEIEKLQGVVMTETGGASLADAMAVTQTVLNRSELWAKTATEIIEAPGQYAEPKSKVNETVKLAFQLVYIEGYSAFKEPVTHFYNKDLCSPAWAEGKAVIGSVGSHVFMY